MQGSQARERHVGRSLMVQWGAWLLFCWLLISFQQIRQRGLTLGDLLQQWVWTPMAATIARLEQAVSSWAWNWKSRQSLIDENLRLRELVQRYQHLEMMYQRLLLEFQEFPGARERAWLTRTRYLWARVLMRSAVPVESHEMVLDRGARHGVHRFDIVATDTGMVGYVDDVRSWTAHVRLITHPLFSAGAEIEGQPYQGLVYGTGRANRLILRYLPQGVNLQPGTRVATSGLEGIFLAHLPLGTILEMQHSVEGDRVYEIATAASLDHLRWVLLLHTGPQDM